MRTMTPEEAAVYLDVKERTISNYRDKGSLETVIEDGRVKVTRESVERVRDAMTVLGRRPERSKGEVTI